MEYDMTFVEVSLRSDSNLGKQHVALPAVLARTPSPTGKVLQSARNSVHRLSDSLHAHLSRRQLDSRPHCSADVAAIEAAILGVQTGAADDEATHCTAAEQPLPAAPTTAAVALDPAAAAPAKPKAGPKSSLTKSVSKLTASCKDVCKAVAAALAPKPKHSSASGQTKGNTSHSTEGADSDDNSSDCNSVMGVDPCEYRFSFSGPLKPSCLLGMRKIPHKQPLKQQAVQAIPTPAPTAAPAAAPSSPSKRFKAGWGSLCRRVRAQAAGRTVPKSCSSATGSLMHSECSHLAQVGSSSRLDARFSCDGSGWGSEAGGWEGEDPGKKSSSGGGL